jgi:small ligand-binding sensory domain FIST
MAADFPAMSRFASSLTYESDPVAAAKALSTGVRRDLDAAVDLAVLFLSPHYGDGVGHLVSTVRESLLPRLMVGCTGEGVIGAGKEIETGAAAALWVARLPRTSLVPLRLTFSSVHDRFTMTGWPDTIPATSASPPVLILFADPFSTPTQELLPLLENRYPGAIAIGGLAGGGREPGENQLILDGEIHDAGLVGVALSGGVSVSTVVSQGCRPIGERYIVTKADENVIHELGGMPALQRLQNIYQSLRSDERELAHRALHIGIAMDEHRERFERGDFLVRNLIGADQETGAMVIGDVAQEGQTVQFHVRDGRSAHEDLKDLLATSRTAGPSPARGALLFSCCGRGKGLFGRADHDVSVIEEHMGPIPVAGRTFLHGYTASIALFSEGEPNLS